MQGSFNVYFNNGNEEQTSFRMNQLRIEAKGNITDRNLLPLSSAFKPGE